MRADAGQRRRASIPGKGIIFAILANILNMLYVSFIKTPTILLYFIVIQFDFGCLLSVVAFLPPLAHL